MHISPSTRMVLIIKTHLVIHAQMFWVKGLAKRQLLRMSGRDTFTYFPLILRESFGFATDFIYFFKFYFWTYTRPQVRHKSFSQQ